MTTAEVLTLTNIILTAIALAVGYSNFKHLREKDFHDILYKTKFDTYKIIIDQCLDVWRQLDINSTPFVEIYDIKDKADWEIYHEKEISKLIHLGFDIQKTVFKYTTYLPGNVMDKVFEFSEKCIRYVVIAYHFDTGLIIEKQDELHKLFFEVVNSFRSDLGIEIIDESLKTRLSQINI